MKKILLLFLILFINHASVFALDIVYPKKNPCSISSGSTFFIGSTNPTDFLKINDIDVKVSPSGAFAQAVPLKFGKNEFKIISGPQKLDCQNTSSPFELHTSVPTEEVQTINFVIDRPQQTVKTYTPPIFLEYPVMGGFFTKNDNVPLRSTPVDGGINRLSHLPKDVELFINGEKNGFYRVFLNSKICGWIDKSSVAKTEIAQQQAAETITNSPAKLKKAKSKLTREFYVYEFELDKKVPFSVSEENDLTFELFNIDGQKDNTLTFNIPINRLMGYDVSFEGAKFLIKVRRIPPINCQRPLKGLTIAVDAGHGGKEAGAIGCCGDKEKDINLAISKNLEQELKSRGANVVMTRERDIDVSLQDRVKIAKEKNADLSISVHANALPDGLDPNKNRGTSVYYYNNQAKPLAESILNSMTTELCTQNDKVRQGSLALTRPTSAVSVLVEVAYIINPDDYALLTDKCFQEKCAKAIADGIEDYLRK